MSIEANRALVQRLFDDVWNADTPDAIADNPSALRQQGVVPVPPGRAARRPD